MTINKRYLYRKKIIKHFKIGNLNLNQEFRNQKELSEDELLYVLLGYSFRLQLLKEIKYLLLQCNLPNEIVIELIDKAIDLHIEIREGLKL